MHMGGSIGVGRGGGGDGVYGDQAHAYSDVDFSTLVITAPIFDSFEVTNVWFASKGVQQWQMAS